MFSATNARTPAWAKRLLFAALCLVLASCGGGGCSSGCSSCGTTPLPGGFPKVSTIPNAASVRVTRPGLDFVQENIGTLAEKALGTGAKAGVVTFPIPPGTGNPKVCSVATPGPSQCNAEIGLGQSKLRVNSITPNRVKIDGLLPVRIRDLPTSYALGLTVKFFVVAGDKTQAPGQDLCKQRGSDAIAFKNFPLNVELPLVTETRIPRNGYTKVDVDKAVIDIGITEADIEVCDDTCGGLPFCQAGFDLVKTFAFNTLVNGVKGQIKTALASAFCTAPTPAVTPACPTGSTPDDADLTKATKCLFDGTQECVPSLLGTDGRMDLSQALINFSPGTQGGLDFVLASAGDMNPAPGDATLPAWTPRSPPVPAEDNTANGISLKMIGGTLPQPTAKCIDVVTNSPPQDIPLPKELQGDTITPWPAGTPGPHLGFAMAGRFLDHAAASAYNSGLLCLGVSTEQVDQLSTGYLSILAPSIKLLTFEQNPASAAITTRPGTPPKITIGNGTDVNKDPLLTIKLEKFAVDFYVFSLDRFVRFFTYTADVTIPVNIQTGKDPKTNPNGGLLPVIGNIGLANASVTNADLLLDDPGLVSGGITGLLGGLVGQFLGGGFSPIDVQAALASLGLGLDIPAGGIRKLTSGTDDFIGVFANLTKAGATAHEEADTRAAIVATVVDRDAMGLTATRARFPTLRVHAEGLATKATEQTWWIDDGTHAPWTRAQELVVDHDTMILQGKHVLHVSSRIVNDMASEDGTPVAIPFTIDTLPPIVEGKREGRRITVRARDYVSSESSLVARRRVGESEAWTDWAPLEAASRFEADATSAVEVEVRDEEGNVGQVSLPLLRGEADSSLQAAGSGCGCRVTGAGGSGGSTSSVAGLGLALGLGLVLRTRRRAVG
jgi:MYXO-CTERM domain-containing protein